MSGALGVQNLDSASMGERRSLMGSLDAVLAGDLGSGGMLAMLGQYHRTLADNGRRKEWDGVLEKLRTMFLCGAPTLMDGPMIGVSMGIRDSDYFRGAARALGKDRSAIANLEWMATLWNATFGPTGLWMGKTFEPVRRETFENACGGNAWMMRRYDPAQVRMGRNFFRPVHGNLLRDVGLPVLTAAWHLRDRPRDAGEGGFEAELLARNLTKETSIPYTKTGGYFLALPATSVVPECQGKAVYHLNYRWPALEPAYPMTRLIDEIVQIDEGIYLGQLVMATHHYSLGELRTPLGGHHEIGEEYHPDDPAGADQKFGYQNNGYFLMIDPALAKDAYSDEAFGYLRPRQGESGYTELGYQVGSDTRPRPVATGGWRGQESLARKFTTFALEDSPKGSADGDITEDLRTGESILEMLARWQGETAKAARLDDTLLHFEKCNKLFRRGIAPGIDGGVFRGQGPSNTCFDAPEAVEWYGVPEPCTGFDYYHGATLNLHFGLCDTVADVMSKTHLLPAKLAKGMADLRPPGILDLVWGNIGRFAFPWAGKSFQRVSGRKLSMLLDESPDLANRYPARVAELRDHPASWPHYYLVLENEKRPRPGAFSEHLACSWDGGMSEADRQFWNEQASTRWVYGTNLQDKRILLADAVMRAADMNYTEPLPSVQALTDGGPSSFVRQGYVFLGAAERESILEMNNGARKKRVFQFHYRFPMIGGAAPIGLCLDEIVEIAQGLFLGQLIYSTALLTPFSSQEDPSVFKYQLFGYFLLLDDTWERHRQEIGFDINV